MNLDPFFIVLDELIGKVEPVGITTKAADNVPKHWLSLLVAVE
jgi:hypothetical protein